MTYFIHFDVTVIAMERGIANRVSMNDFIGVDPFYRNEFLKEKFSEAIQKYIDINKEKIFRQVYSELKWEEGTVFLDKIISIHKI